jgi:hypothetical protein
MSLLHRHLNNFILMLAFQYICSGVMDSQTLNTFVSPYFKGSLNSIRSKFRLRLSIYFAYGGVYAMVNGYSPVLIKRLVF